MVSAAALVDLAALGVDAVLRDVVATHRQEGAGADMQGQRDAAGCRAASSAASRAEVKCSPAVGAATAPSCAANTVW